MEKKPFKGPDLHAPRNRSKATNLLAYPKQDPHGFFAATKEKYHSLAKLSNKDIARILKVTGEILANEVITNKRGIKLPGGLGAVIVGRTIPTEKTRTFNIDYNTSKQLGFTVPYRNDHSQRTIAKIYHTTIVHGCQFRKHYHCSFKPCRNLKKSVAAVMKTEGGCHNYLLSTPQYPITNFFRKHKPLKPTWRAIKAEQDRKKQDEEYQNMLAVYDEFRFD